MSNSETMRIPFHSSIKRHHTSANIMPRQLRQVSKAELVADEIVHLLENYGTKQNDNEPVSKVSHMVQCAMLAMTSQNSLPVIIGALLHDIGSLITIEQSTETINKLKLLNDEDLGAAYLRTKGFSEHVCTIADQQAAAKRYLAATDEMYQKSISPERLLKLNIQGGPMSANEIMAFEKHIHFKDIINVSRWDEEAKNPKAALLPVTWFKKLLWDHLYYRVA